MKQFLATVSAVAITTTGAYAGGIERSAGSVALLFEKGNYAELSFGSVNPSVSGVQAIPFVVPAGASSGEVAGSYTALTLGVKEQLNDKIAIALIIDQPIGADVDYAPGTGYVYGLGAGSQATIDAVAATALIHYRFSENLSVYGGLKAEQVSGKVALFNGYSMSTSKETDLGYLIGAAYERPDIALRVGLTYASAITHKFDVTENGTASLPFETEVPQSLTLDFQSGIAANTLLFGSIRWREWSEFDITPVGFAAAGGGSLVSYENDTITYNIGVGRKFNDSWSAAVTVGHEKSNGGFSGNLGPTDGYTSLGVGATYTKGNMKLTGGVSYIWIGDAKTEAPAPAPEGTTLANFEDNNAIGVGFKVGFSF
jgi:long-chain fatty acid transport protein